MACYKCGGGHPAMMCPNDFTQKTGRSSGGGGGGKGSGAGGVLLIAFIAAMAFGSNSDDDDNPRTNNTNTGVAMIEPLSFTADERTHRVYHSTNGTHNLIAISYSDKGRFFLALGDNEEDLKRSVTQTCLRSFSNETCKVANIFRREDNEEFCAGIRLFKSSQSTETGETRYYASYRSFQRDDAESLVEALYNANHRFATLTPTQIANRDLGKVAICNFEKHQP